MRRDGRNVIRGADSEFGDTRIVVRRSTSDLPVFRQVFLQCQYEPLVRAVLAHFPRESVRTIVDAGANIGLASVYLAKHFPGAQIFALEAEAHNAVLCRCNFERNGIPSAAAQHRALWSSERRLQVGKGFRDGRSWAFQVKADNMPKREVIEDVEAVTVAGLIRDRRLEQIDVLKIDIEGAELEVFAEHARPEEWLPMVRSLGIEIHSPKGRERIIPLLERSGFSVFDEGELTIAVRAETGNGGLPRGSRADDDRTT